MTLVSIEGITQGHTAKALSRVLGQSSEPVTLVVATAGGDWSEAAEMVDVIAAHRGPVETVIRGDVDGAAALVALAGCRIEMLLGSSITVDLPPASEAAHVREKLTETILNRAEAGQLSNVRLGTQIAAERFFESGLQIAGCDRAQILERSVLDPELKVETIAPPRASVEPASARRLRRDIDFGPSPAPASKQSPAISWDHAIAKTNERLSIHPATNRK